MSYYPSRHDKKFDEEKDADDFFMQLKGRGIKPYEYPDISTDGEHTGKFLVVWSE